MAPLSFTFVRSKYHNPLAVGTAHHRIEVELQSMRASSWRVHGYRAKYFFAERARAQQDDSLETRGALSLSLFPMAGHYLVVLARFVYQTMPCFLYRPVSPVRFAESFHAQYTNPLSNKSTPSSNREKPFRKKSCRRMIIWSRFTIFPNRSMNDRWYHLSEYYFSFEDETISRNPNIDAILFLFLHNSSNDKIYAQNSKSS